MLRAASKQASQPASLSHHPYNPGDNDLYMYRLARPDYYQKKWSYHQVCIFTLKKWSGNIKYPPRCTFNP